MINIMEGAVKIRRDTKDFVEVEERELKRVVAKLRRVTEAQQPLAEDNVLQRILTNTEEIKKKVAATGPQGAKSWSQVAATQPVVTAQIQRHQAAERRKDRELIVTIENQEQKEQSNRKTTDSLIEVVRAKEPRKATSDIALLRCLPSGDYQIITATEASKQALEKTDDWLRAIAPSASLKRATFTVRAHGVRVQAVDTGNQKEILTTIREMNQRLHPDTDLVRVAWNKRTTESGQRYGSLIVETGSIEAANRLISHGLIHEGEVKFCDRFVREARITQCIRCNKYGHVARVCKNQAACGRCAGTHLTNDCEKNQEVKKCALCQGNHHAWAKTCQHRQREAERAQIALRTAPTFYERVQSPTSSYNEPRPTFTFRAEEEEGWQIVAKGRKGRPTHLATAAKAHDQTRIGMKRQRRESSPQTLVTDRNTQIRINGPLEDAQSPATQES
jgi:hypothetical protein